MQQPRIFVGEDLNREPGYTIFTLEGISGVVDRISYSVVRHGYDFNYLGEKEWQAAFSWLEPEDAWYENGTLKFIVPPDVTWQLEPQGYVLRLNLTPTIGDVSFDFFWPDVLPAESTGQPSNAQRLSGTRVKPVTADTSGQPSAIKTVVPAATNEDLSSKMICCLMRSCLFLMMRPVFQRWMIFLRLKISRRLPMKRRRLRRIRRVPKRR